MNTPKRSVGRRLVAALGAAALSLVGIAGVASAADPTTVGPTDPSNTQTTGSLTIHKIDGSETDQTNDGTVKTVAGTPLSGVTFTVRPVTAKSGTAINLATAAGWDLISGATVSEVTQSGGAFTLGPATEQVTDPNGQAAFTGLALGLYLVQETNPGTNPIVTPAAPFLVTIPLNQKDAQGHATDKWIYDVNAYPKNQLASGPIKTVSSPDGNLGGTVKWTISAPIPQLNTTDKLTSYSISDNLDVKLSYQGEATVTVQDQATGYLVANTDYTLTEPAIGNAGGMVTVQFSDDGLKKLAQNPGKNIVLTFATKVTAAGIISNEATTNVNGNEFTSAPQTTEWGGITLTKEDASTSAKLAGAEFSIYNSDGNGTATGSPLANATTNASGTLSFGPLWVSNNGTPTSREYVLVETKAPDGYVLDPTPHVVTVTADEDATYATTTVDNTKPIVPNLPLTGANGQLLALIGGGSLVLLAAGTALVARKRSHQD